MKKIITLLLAAAMLVACTACGETTTSTPDSNNSTAQTTTATTTNETSADKSDESTNSVAQGELSEEDMIAEMVNNSFMTTGDISRMAKALAKAEKGEEITIAYIGGSITEGMTVGAETCWAKLSYEWLCKQYPNTKINYVNAGMSGTPSVLGNVRLERDVLSAKPDIVFVEFAVNDAQDQPHKASYESLVKTLLTQEQQPAVALFFTVIKSGYTCQEHMSQIGENYNLPMVSLTNALQPEFDANRLTWEKYSDDESHPNEWGHQVVAQMIENLFTKIKDEMKSIDTENITIPAVTDKVVFSDDYMNMKLLDKDNIDLVSTGSFVEKESLSQFPNGWVHLRGTDAFTFKFTGKNLFLLYRCSASQKNGTVKVVVDGVEASQVQAYSTDGWNNPVAQLAFSGESGEHTVEITMVDGDEDLLFCLLGFGYNA